MAITIEHRIADRNLVPFLNAMSERRRIRRRDGARPWTLLRDLSAPELWVERCEVPTWLDYVRHNQRRTQAVAENGDRLLVLHVGPDGPRVHRTISASVYGADTMIDPIGQG